MQAQNCHPLPFPCRHLRRLSSRFTRDKMQMCRNPLSLQPASISSRSRNKGVGKMGVQKSKRPLLSPGYSEVNNFAGTTGIQSSELATHVLQEAIIDRKST